MHLVLTDRLTCPRCGPAFGLILLAESLADRRVLEGHLGCPNCREKYVVHEGFGDLRAPPRVSLGERPPPEPVSDDQRVGQLRTLLGAGQATGHTVTVGRAAAWAPALAAGLGEGAEVVAVAAATQGWEETPGVSRLAAAPGLPFFDRSMRGVLLHGADLDASDPGGEDAARRLVAEAARVLAPACRVVVLEPPRDIEERLRGAGLPEAIASSSLAAAGR